MSADLANVALAYGRFPRPQLCEQCVRDDAARDAWLAEQPMFEWEPRLALRYLDARRVTNQWLDGEQGIRLWSAMTH